MEVALFYTDTVVRTDVTRLITAFHGCFSKVFNNDDGDYYNNNKLYQKQVANALSFEEINMSSTEIERRPGALHWKTASLIESQNEYFEKCKVKVG